MTQPDVEHVLPATGPVATAVRGVRQKYQMLPHARPGGIAGLMEILHDHGGREDLYSLSEQLAMDVDDLLPIVEASVMLGFANLKEGEVEINPEGVAFADSDILTQKVLFREAALRHVAILQSIDSVLHAKSDHSIPEEFFHDILDEHFSQDEVERQLETAMNWGRYAEIFDYDAERGRLVLAEHAPETPPAALQP
jgi:NitT/TauT family transport system ATP-binding protein